jgi:hypothetical protein
MLNVAKTQISVRALYLSHGFLGRNKLENMPKEASAV